VAEGSQGCLGCETCEGPARLLFEAHDLENTFDPSVFWPFPIQGEEVHRAVHNCVVDDDGAGEVRLRVFVAG